MTERNIKESNIRVLELFSGTHSVGKVCKELGFEVTSLDLSNADINCDILSWNYKEAFEVGHFDIIWASPPCTSFSKIQIMNTGQSTHPNKEQVLERIQREGLPILNKTLEIIDYLKPKWYFIENPSTGSMKNYIREEFAHFFYDIDYCRYSDFGYKKPTRIWVNQLYKQESNFEPLKCQNRCNNRLEGRKKHRINVAKSDSRLRDHSTYRVPHQLILNLFRRIPE